MVLIYGAARGHSRLAKQIYGERFPQRVLPNARTCVNVVQHLRDFGCFEMNLRDLGRQRKDRILVAEEILHESGKPVTNEVLGVLQITCGSFTVYKFETPLRKFVKTEAFCIEFGVLEVCIANDGKHFEQLF
jgi:hypothetical protein